jgi:hypothetical protein
VNAFTETTPAEKTYLLKHHVTESILADIKMAF